MSNQLSEQTLTGSLQLSAPEWLWLLPAIVLISLLVRAIGRRDQSASVLSVGTSNRDHFIHPLIHLLPRVFTHQRASSFRALIHVLLFVSLVVCLAEPVRIGAQRPDPPPERDIVFIVDTSVSMDLRDYVLNNERIDRMSMLKVVLDRFIQQLAGDRLAIIIFADNAYTLVPLTRDQALLRSMAARIQTTMAGRFNNVGEAISLAIKQTETLQATKRHRVLVLLTDADGSTGIIKPETAAELVLDAGLPLYSVAIGASSASAEEKRITGLIYEPVDLPLLADISARTGARSYQAGDVQALEQAIADISQHESNARELAPRYYRQALYLWPLLFALGLVILLSLLSWLPILSTRRQVSSTANDAGEHSA